MTLILPVDTAVALLVNVVPLTDDTDFKTRKTSVAYNASGMDLVWNFQATDGTITQTAVTPTSGGDYDWSHVGDGLYKIEMPASGGASANNDSEGYGFFSGVCDGVLPWRGPTYTFVPAAIVNSLVGGTDNLPVDVVQIGGNTQSATDLKDFADTGYDPSSHKVAGVVLVDTCTTNTDMRGTDNASTFDPGSDTVTVGANQDKTGYALTEDYDPAKTAAQAGDEMDLVDAPNATAVAVIQSGLSTLDAAGVRSAVGLASANLDTQLGDIPTVAEFEARTILAASYSTLTTADIDARLAAIHLDHLLATDYDPASKPGVGTALLNELIENNAGVSRFTAAALAQAPSGGTSAADIADAVWDEASADHNTAGTVGEKLNKIIEKGTSYRYTQDAVSAANKTADVTIDDIP